MEQECVETTYKSVVRMFSWDLGVAVQLGPGTAGDLDLHCCPTEGLLQM